MKGDTPERSECTIGKLASFTCMLHLGSVTMQPSRCNLQCGERFVPLGPRPTPVYLPDHGMQIAAGTSHGAQAAIGGDGMEVLPLEFKPNFPIGRDYKGVLTPP